MTTTKVRPVRGLALLAITALLTTPLLASVDDTIRKSFKVDQGGTLEIDSDIGGIEVRGGSDDEVTIEVEQSVRTSDRDVARRVLDKLDIDFRQSGNDVIVRARYDGPRENGWSIFDLFSSRARDERRLRIQYVVHVPSRYNVELKTSGGNISVDDLDGRVEARTSGGNLKLGRIEGTVVGHTSGGDIAIERSTGSTEARTSGGNIVVEDSEGPVDVRTSGGDIKVLSARGKVYARTSGGSIEARGALGSIDASTSGGSVVARLTEQPTGNCRLATSGGSVTVYVAGGIDFDIDASASGGSIDVDVPVTVEGRYSRDRVTGRVNSGGPTLTLRSSGGGIRVREQ